MAQGEVMFDEGEDFADDEDLLAGQSDGDEEAAAAAEAAAAGSGDEGELGVSISGSEGASEEGEDESEELDEARHRCVESKNEVVRWGGGGGGETLPACLPACAAITLLCSSVRSVQQT
jgi:hypothetical protein